MSIITVLVLSSVSAMTFAVIPVFLGPLQVLLTLLPGLLAILLAALVRSFQPAAWRTVAAILWRQKLQIVVLFVALTAVVWGTGLALARLGPQAAAAEPGSLDWPTARGELLRRGFLATANGPQATSSWRFQRRGEMFLSSPAVQGNRVYASSAHLGLLRDRGSIWCFDADTGLLAWSAAPASYAPTFSSPVITDERLVCGEGLHSTRGARIVCLDLRPGREGSVLWTHATSSHVECTPCVSNGRVYVGAGDDGIYCLDLEGSADGNARVVWYQPGDQYPDAETSLAVDGGRVYAGLGLRGEALCVLDAETGHELQRIGLPHPAFGPPSIAAGKLYIGTGNGSYTRVGTEGAVVCIDLQTLTIDSTCELPGAVLGSVACADDELYFAAQDGCVYCLDAQGRQVSRWNTFAAIHASPAVTQRHVFVVNADGVLFALARKSLQPTYEYTLGPPGLYVSSPVVARGRVFVGSEHGFHGVALPPGDQGDWVARGID